MGRHEIEEKYMQASFSSSDMRIIKEKSVLLDDMSTSITFLVNNKNYIQMYYLLDDEIINKGNLTLISPNYATHLSQLLELSFDKIKLSKYSKDTIISAKNDVLHKIKADCKQQETGVINKL